VAAPGVYSCNICSCVPILSQSLGAGILHFSVENIYSAKTWKFVKFDLSFSKSRKLSCAFSEPKDWLMSKEVNFDLSFSKSRKLSCAQDMSRRGGCSSDVLVDLAP
jgi:hypothetical protein